MTNSIGQILLYESLGLSHLLEAKKPKMKVKPPMKDGKKGKKGKKPMGDIAAKYPPHDKVTRGDFIAAAIENKKGSKK